MNVDAKTAIVTGAASGIGYSIAETLMEHDISVIIADIDKEGAVEASQTLSDSHSSTAIPIKCDVTKSPDVENLVAEAVSELGPIDVLVNNAGIGGLDRAWEIDESDWDRVLDVNLKGTFLCTKHVVSHMLEEDIEGNIVNIGSIAGEAASDGFAHYSSAKAGVKMFTEVVAAEVGQYGIRMNAIAPGTVKTPLIEDDMLQGPMKAEYLDRTPLGRIGQPADIADVAVFLLGTESRFITGEIVSVDGGMHIWGQPPTWSTFHDLDIADE